MNQFLTFETTQRISKQEKSRRTMYMALLVSLLAVGFFAGQMISKSGKRTVTRSHRLNVLKKVRAHKLRFAHKSKIYRAKSLKVHKEEENKDEVFAFADVATFLQGVVSNFPVHTTDQEEYNHALANVYAGWVHLHKAPDGPEEFHTLMDDMDSLELFLYHTGLALTEVVRDYPIGKFKNLTLRNL
jgi:hypothetical protein